MIPQLEAEGFKVLIQPSRSMLPRFLSTFRPDAIAVKGEKKLAIDVVAGVGHQEAMLERAREVLSQHPELGTSCPVGSAADT
ncbi:MAG: hypothetical protein JOY71_17985 [Acetobacteraceae bacterium]|nr:hypothetical protein [Acetobacteraceae bacterium]MBV8523984.1 hypothetical protein [Acetobacteraceae bacterium]